MLLRHHSKLLHLNQTWNPGRTTHYYKSTFWSRTLPYIDGTHAPVDPQGMHQNLMCIPRKAPDGGWPTGGEEASFSFPHFLVACTPPVFHS